MTSEASTHLVATADSERLDLYLHAQFPDRSRSLLQRMIRQGHVRLRKQPCSPKSSVKAGDVIDIEFPQPEAPGMEPESLALDVLLEDAHLIVVNKPAGMVVHPGAGHAAHTLVHALLHHCRGQLSGIGGVERPGIVHRLDKETSGCLVAAKTDEAHRRLAASFQSREVEKIYLAFVRGCPRTASGRIDQPIGRHAVHRHKMCVTSKGRPALTEWKIRERLGKLSLLECRIHSGRTHQIRVHLAFIGHPVVADPIYGQTGNAELRRAAGRQMLHAWRLAFDHPHHGVRTACEAPIPEDMRRLILEGHRTLL
ncbi:MAG: RluA family pseudouridine synthase [Verrucomicrobia bacterium]|nr:RluA family pseudouridine synthase [Verrucomicrobiota bacterium]